MDTISDLFTRADIREEIDRNHKMLVSDPVHLANPVLHPFVSVCSVNSVARYYFS